MVVLNFSYYLNVQRKDKVISMKYSGDSKLATYILRLDYSRFQQTHLISKNLALNIKNLENEMFS